MGDPTRGRSGGGALDDRGEGPGATDSLRVGVFTPGTAFGLILVVFGLFYYAETSRDSQPRLPFPAWRKIETKGGIVAHLAFDAAGRTLYSGDSTRGEITAWIPATGQMLARFQEFSGSKVSALTLSPDGKILAGAFEGKGLALWDTNTGMLLARLDPEYRQVSALKFSPDGRELISAGRDGVIRVYDVSTRRVRNFASVPEHGGSVSLDLSPDGRFLTAVVMNASFLRWDFPGGKLLESTRGRRELIVSVASSPDGKSLALSCWDGRFQLWDTATLQERSTPPQTELSALLCLAFSPNGRLLATGHADQTIRVWDLSSNRLVHRFIGHGSLVTALAFTPDGRTLASGSADTTILLWDMDKAAESTSELVQ